jgi:adenylate cyclase
VSRKNAISIHDQRAEERLPSSSNPAQSKVPLRRFTPLLVLAAICAAWVAASQIPLIPRPRGAPLFLGADGLLELLEHQTVLARYRFRGELPSPLRIVYVDVDTDALAALGNFPWNRSVFAQVIDALFDHGKVRGIGLDFVFSVRGIPNLGRAQAVEGNLALGRAVRRHANGVVLAASYGSERGLLGKRGGFPFLFDRRTNIYDADLPELPDFPVVGPTWGRLGLIDVPNDEMRYVPMFAPTEAQTYLAMSLQLALIHYGLPPAAAEIGPVEIVLRGEDGAVRARIPLWLRQLVEPNWFSPWISAQNPRAGVAGVLDYARLATEGDDGEKAEAARFFAPFKDAIVLVGPTDPLLKDVGQAPMNGGKPVPRVSLHGNMLKMIVGDRFLHRPSVWANAGLITLTGFASAALAFGPSRGSRGWRFLCVAPSLLVIGAAFALFARADLIIPVVAPLGAAITCAIYAAFHRLAREEVRRRRIKSLFGSYVSAHVVEEIVEREEPLQTGGEEREITAYFSDVVSFTRISELLPAPLLVSLMSEYFGRCTAAITADGGTLDKYVGDAVVAMFGAPLPRADHAAAACRAALAVQEAQAQLRVRWSGQGGLPPEVASMRTRIGMHSGMAVVGNVGSDLRFNFTMMGHTVNLASRLEGAASHYGVGILVSSETAVAAAAHDQDLVFRPLDSIKVAGQSAPVAVEELIGRGRECLEQTRVLREIYAEALALYRARQWARASAVFRRAAEDEPPRARSNPSEVMARRCEAYAETGAAPPGPDFQVRKV